MAVLGLAIGIGFGLGALSYRIVQHALQSDSQALAVDIDVAVDCICQMLLTAFAVNVLRTVEARKVWLAAGLLTIPVVGAQHARDYHPLLVLLAESTWFLTLLACAREKRTWGALLIVICAACTTSIKVSSRMALYEARQEADWR
ncbi:MAG TPA: hypothetical protein VJV79_12805 [Polyangiaceae bacterium]|nr:hypothetical protein [Polyangiaceae bacterium]